MTSASAGLRLLKGYYSHVSTLKRYLSSIVPHAQFSEKDDGPSFSSFIDSCIIGTNQPSDDWPSFQYWVPARSQKEIIGRAQEKLLKQGEERNILSLGYRLVDQRAGNYGEFVINLAVNTNVQLLRNNDWKTLLERIGESPMFHLLTTTAIFIPLENNCFTQISGIPITDLTVRYPDSRDADIVSSKTLTKRPTSNNPEDNGRPAKKVRLNRQEENTNLQSRRPTTKWRPVDIPILRSRTFYAQPAKSPNKVILLGLPLNHILNRLPPPLNSDTDKQSILKLAKYVFPRQFGLENPFTCDKKKYSPFPYPDYTDREREIQRASSIKTPKRVKDALMHLDSLLTRHKACSYRKLCDLVCPSKLKSGTDANHLDPAEILGIISEASQTARTQGTNTTMEVSHMSMVIPHGAAEAQQSIQAKPKFAEFACSHNDVYRFVVAATKQVIPEAFWGSQANFRVLLKHVQTFILCRRFETVTLHTVSQDIKLNDCTWLIPSGAEKGKRTSVSDDLKRRELWNEFLYWFFESFLVPLLKTTFYVTESSAFRHQILYFRQDDWNSICAPLLKHLRDKTFTHLDINKFAAKSMCEQRQLGFSRLRLLPKETGVRPIVNLKRKTHKGWSINQILQSTFQVLTYEKSHLPELLGASVTGLNEIYAQLKAYRERIMTKDRTLPKLYFVKVDVRAAFDTIDQEKLLEILTDIISADEYIIHGYVQVSPTLAKGQRNYRKKAFPEWEQASFQDLVSELAQTLKNTIFVDQVNTKTIDRQKVLSLLKEHIKENLVRIGPDLCKQTVGIPQGSVLSTLLCSFFYGDMERKKLGFRDDPRNLMLRYVDDYLFITTHKPSALKFLDAMALGHPEYGCFITPEKTLTNFETDAHQTMVVKQAGRFFPWCGILIDVRRLSVQADYTRLQGCHIATTLTVERGRAPGAAFRYKMLRAAKLRNHVIYNDTALNTRKTVYINVYQNFIITAMKMHSYITSWGIDTSIHTKFIYTTICEVIRFTFGNICNKVRSKLARKSGARLAIEKVSVRWLGLHAFHRVLNRKQTKFRELLELLSRDMGMRLFAGTRQRLEALVLRDTTLETLGILY
ncbi:hypothetical protein FRC03_006703 [Tulasnella sp. 419]|nr:hypothetical protein FRC03_006703 [Tulasnella sp. 419]